MARALRVRSPCSTVGVFYKTKIFLILLSEVKQRKAITIRKYPFLLCYCLLAFHFLLVSHGRTSSCSFTGLQSPFQVESRVKTANLIQYL